MLRKKKGEVGGDKQASKEVFLCKRECINRIQKEILKNHGK